MMRRVISSYRSVFILLFVLGFAKATALCELIPPPCRSDGGTVRGRVRRRVPFRDCRWMPLTGQASVRLFEAPEREKERRGVMNRPPGGTHAQADGAGLSRA